MFVISNHEKLTELIDDYLIATSFMKQWRSTFWASRMLSANFKRDKAVWMAARDALDKYEAENIKPNFGSMSLSKYVEERTA